jgi:choline dehydrogenase-like flavoprotein
MANDQVVDVCIVGSGAGGATVAYALGTAGFTVVVLEAGPRYDPSHYPLNTQEWEQHSSAFRVAPQDRAKHAYSSAATEELDSNYAHLRSWSEARGQLNPTQQRRAPRVHRVKGVGGTTLHYQGEAHRFSPHGFRSKSLFDFGEDWPLGYDNLAPYYERIENLLGVSGDHRNPFKAPRGPFPHAPHQLSCASQHVKVGFDRLGLHLLPNSLAILSRPFDGRPSCNYCNGCSMGCMMQAKGSADVTLIPKAEATGHVQVRSNSTVHQVTLDSRGKVNGVLYFDGENVEHRIKAKIVVVSAGALESPRLLLHSSSSEFPDGLANRSGLVGRYFMETLVHITTALFSEPIQSYKGLQIDSRAWDYNEPRKGQSFQGGVVFGVSALNYLGPLTYAQRIAAGWGKGHKDFMRSAFGHVTNVFAIGEHSAAQDNNVTLDLEQKDFYGIPVAKISTKLAQNELETLSFMAEKCRAIAEAAGAERIIGEQGSYDLSMITHMSGTCRMGSDAKKSVVNSFCQSHDVPNLFVIDSSCFVSEGGGDSPSLTIQAIALRASEYLIEEAKRGNLS